MGLFLSICISVSLSTILIGGWHDSTAIATSLALVCIVDNHRIALHCIVLWSTWLYSTILHCKVLHCSALCTVHCTLSKQHCHATYEWLTTASRRVGDQDQWRQNDEGRGVSLLLPILFLISTTSHHHWWGCILTNSISISLEDDIANLLNSSTLLYLQIRTSVL